ncbi:MAG: shikimate kinase [Pyrinomonas sp.]|uniref:shikimate kinase n=1 Tax=Pyrinomonas sp. TaxID=2080306 RepID=UPI003318622C
MSVAPRIALLGFMGVGKTTVARALADRLGCSMIDLDRRITEREGRSIATIIAEEGEERFRAIEADALREVLAEAGAMVVALGGGAWTIEPNRQQLTAAGVITVWLDAPFELCWQRINASTEERPLARSEEVARALYERRRSLYALASLRVEASADKAPAELAEQIARALNL